MTDLPIAGPVAFPPPRASPVCWFGTSKCRGHVRDRDRSIGWASAVRLLHRRDTNAPAFERQSGGEIVQARTTAGERFAQPGLPRQRIKGSANIATVQTVPAT